MGVDTNLVFTSGSENNATECVNISIVDDGALEGDQHLSLALSTTDTDVVVAGNMTLITITDNDST